MGSPTSGGDRPPPSLSRPPLPIETAQVASFDGTHIAYHRTAAPFPGAKTVVLASGLGGPHIAWRALIEYLSDRYRFITWDYRGLYLSQRPAADVVSAYSVAHHVRDLRAILEAEGVEHGALVGWSMGVQIALEATRMLPGWAEALVLMNGTYRRPLETLGPVPGVGRMLPTLVDLAGHAHALAGRVTRSATRKPKALEWMKRVGLLGNTVEPDLFAELVASFDTLDLSAFFKNLRALDAHDAEELLDQIHVPTLVVTGDRDAFTPRALAQSMARRIPAAEILVVRGGTHYAAIEYPELVSLRIERFFLDHGF